MATAKRPRLNAIASSTGSRDCSVTTAPRVVEAVVRVRDPADVVIVMPAGPVPLMPDRMIDMPVLPELHCTENRPSPKLAIDPLALAL